MSYGPSNAHTPGASLTEGLVASNWQPRRRGTSELRSGSAWADRGSLLLDLPDSEAMDRRAARPFKAMLIGIVIAIGTLIVVEAAMESVHPPHPFAVATLAG